MKRIVLALIVAMLVSGADAATRRSIADVATDDLTTDTQVTPSGSGDSHVAVCWWVPIELWEALFSRDTTTSETDKKNMLATLRDVSMVAIVQADISAMGAFRYYSKEEIEESMTIVFVGGAGKRLRIAPIQEIDPDLEVLIGVFKPILGAAMGNLGNNMHFYVLNDRTPSGERILDPYRAGLIEFQLAKRGGELMKAEVPLPLNSLFVPRKCPNGRDAHVSWRYCPWTGKALD